MMTSSIRASAGSPDRSTAARIATAPSSTAGTDESIPPNFPMSVLAALTINACPSGPLEGCIWPSVHRARTGEADAYDGPPSPHE